MRRLLPSVNRENADITLVGLVIRKADRIQTALLVTLKSVNNLNTVLVRIYIIDAVITFSLGSVPFVFLVCKTLSHLFGDN